MTKIAVLADLHLRGKDAEKTLEALEDCFERARAKGATALAFCGDFVDKWNLSDPYMNPVDLLQTCHHAKDLFRGFPEIFCVTGNHDSPNDTQIAIMDLLKLVADEEPKENQNPESIYHLHWHYNRVTEELLQDILEEIRIYKSRLLIGHARTFGGYLGNGQHYSDAGDWVFPAEFWEEVESLGCIVKLGDFHARQPWYVGAFRQKDFGESGNPAGLELLDLATGEIEWIENKISPRHNRVKVYNSADIEKNLAIIPAQNTLNKFTFCNGFVPTPTQVQEMEDKEWLFDFQPVKVEREQRVQEDLKAGPGEAIDPAKLFDIYLQVNKIEMNEARKTEMISLIRRRGGAA